MWEVHSDPVGWLLVLRIIGSRVTDRIGMLIT